MKRKILIIFLAITTVLACVFIISACKKEHKHSFTQTVVVPTCTDLGYTINTCECGFSYKDDYVNSTGHDYKQSTVEPTCTEQGYTLNTCECGHCYKDNYVNSTGHDYKQSIVAPTCTEQGYTLNTCDCGHSFKDNYIEAKGHTPVIDKPAVEATCVKSGLTESSHCKDCDEILSEQTIVPVKPHTVVIDVEAVENTCINAGTTEGSHCKVCKAVLSEAKALPMKDHEYKDDVCTACNNHLPTEGLTYEKCYDGYAVTGLGNVTAFDIHIASTYKGEPVTQIGELAFLNCNFNSVTIPNTITRVGGDAFASGTINDLYYSGDLTGWCNIYFEYAPPLVHTNPLDATENFYINNELVTKLDIPESVKKINAYAFQGYNKLTSVNIPKIKNLGTFAFYECEGLLSVNIAGVEFIGANAFVGCTQLSDISIGDGDTKITNDVFKDTIFYNTQSNWKNGVLYLDNHLIKADTSVSGTYKIKDGTKSVAYNAFENCENLTSVIVPDGVTVIGRNAFKDCTKLANVQLPDSINYIGSKAFANTALYNDTSNRINDDLYIGNHLIELKGGSILYYIEEGTITIAEAAGMYNFNAHIINLPDSVKNINSQAFCNCTALSSINIPNGVTKISQSAFQNCAIETITLPSSITEISSRAFFDCDDLKLIQFEGSIAEWKAIEKSEAWDDHTGDYKVVCNDGTIEKAK